MQKDLNFTELYGEYKLLLTDNQTEIFELYYLCDLSLSEISQMKNISRQGVSDSLSKTRELLIAYEGKLQLLSKKRKMLEVANTLNSSNVKEELIKLIGDKYGRKRNF